jgi:hypothetical protein
VCAAIFPRASRLARGRSRPDLPSRATASSTQWGCDVKLADKICNFNRHYAEASGSFLATRYVAEVRGEGEMTYYDSNTGKPLFVAPRGRSFNEYLAESRDHGWPSFRDAEVVWENVRVLPDGETVSVDGTHLGHDIPDGKGNRCEAADAQTAGVRARARFKLALAPASR